MLYFACAHGLAESQPRALKWEESSGGQGQGCAGSTAGWNFQPNFLKRVLPQNPTVTAKHWAKCQSETFGHLSKGSFRPFWTMGHSMGFWVKSSLSFTYARGEEGPGGRKWDLRWDKATNYPMRGPRSHTAIGSGPDSTPQRARVRNSTWPCGPGWTARGRPTPVDRTQ